MWMNVLRYCVPAFIVSIATGAVVTIATVIMLPVCIDVDSTDGVHMLNKIEMDVEMWWVVITERRATGSVVRDLGMILRRVESGDDPNQVLDDSFYDWLQPPWVRPSPTPQWSRIGWTDGVAIEAEQGRGWPAIAAWSDLQPPGHQPAHGVLLDASPSDDLFVSDWVIPYRVVWPGFALNVTFFATVSCVVYAFCFATRRWVRRRRGRCPCCAYPIDNAIGGCPECGWHRDSRESAECHAAKP